VSVSEVDVAVVGFGPVGQAVSAWLTRAGHRVAAFERFNEIYRLPRAVHMDHEIMRLMQDLGVARELEEGMFPLRDYLWYGADGEPVMTLNSPRPSVSGWEPSYLFFQPELERILIEAGQEQVELNRGWVVEGLEDTGDGAELTLRRNHENGAGKSVTAGETRTVQAAWVIGADGANSFVRENAGITRRDLGFQERWLVVDVEPHDPAALDHLPPACQWCDPERPATHVRSGLKHHRWEFMLLPGEETSDFEDPATAWSLLEPWFTPAEGTMTRTAVYEFRSMLADRMRSGRVLLAGDSAHLTPPFLGQGLCSGLRDAANLAWKLDLVLRDKASDALLDTIETERQPQTEWIIQFAIQLGKVLCELNPDGAAERDANLRGADEPPPIEPPALTEGVVHQPDASDSDPLAGRLGVQGMVAFEGFDGRLDDMIGGGWTLITTAPDPLAGLGEPERQALETLEVTVVSLDPDSPFAVTDLDGRLTGWLEESGVCAVLVRPDFYVFGSSEFLSGLPALVAGLRDLLALKPKPLVKE